MSPLSADTDDQPALTSSPPTNDSEGNRRALGAGRAELLASGMELFAITCTTCKSRLNVRDRAAIGQILACPKCGGMVMVKPPPAFSEATDQRSDLPTATEVEGQALEFGRTPNSSAFDALDDLLSDAPPRTKPPPSSFTPPPSAPTMPKPRFVGGPPVHRSATPPVPKRSATPPLPANVASSQPVTTKPSSGAAESVTPKKTFNNSESSLPIIDDRAPPAPPSTEVVAARPRSNYWLLMAGSIVLGVGLALIAVCAVILLRPTSEQAAHPVIPVKKSDITANNQPKATTVTSAAPTLPSSPPESVLPAPTPTPEANPTLAVGPEALTTPATDPLGLTPSSPPSATPQTAAVIPDSLAKFDRIIDAPSGDPLAKPATTAPAISIPPTVPDTAPARPLAPRPPPRDVDVAKNLEYPLLGIETTGMPLANFVQLISNISAIPITLDVPFPPATPESSIVLKSTNTTVRKALSEALAAWKLEYVISDDQLIIHRPEPTPFAPLTVDVQDLTAGDGQQTSELVELLEAVIEPGSWGEGDGQGNVTADAAKGSLVIRNRRATQFQVLIAIEKLRAGRTPPISSKTKLDPALLNLDSRLKQAGPRLAKRISLNYGQPTKLLEILDNLGRATGLRILVDWHDVAAAGWNPAAEATLVVSNQPVVDALDALLTPLDLTARIIDAQTLQVVTPARLAAQGELEFYKVADVITAEITADILVARIRAALGDESFIAGGGNGEIRFDDATKCLLAWLPQPKQQQLEVLLTTWRTKAK
jgi:hypothetical protein